jgi:hypothetical protein
MHSKFNRKMLIRAIDPGTAPKDQVKTEVQKVMNQIHDYQDMHNCRFGYIITETQLVVFRWRDEEQK